MLPVSITKKLLTSKVSRIRILPIIVSLTEEEARFVKEKVREIEGAFEYFHTTHESDCLVHFHIMYKNDCLVNEETRKAVIGKLRDGSFKRLKTVINKLTKENISFRVKNVYFRVRSSQIFENSVIMGLNVQLNIT